MRCHDVQEAVVTARYDGGEVPADVAAHVASCAGCAAFARQSAALEGLLAAETDLALRPGFDTRFRARLAEQEAGRGRGLARLAPWRWPRLAIAGLGVAVAAVVVAAVVVGVGGRRAGPSRPELAAGELSLAMNLDLLEDLEVVARLDEAEVLDLVERAGPDAFEAAVRETRSLQ
jgi:hypothetical protein